ncbi:hypothetical protein AaE_013144 [Aphanomyces astaci]|uniref:Armadillo repeat-containing domain-containing protein n=1 Tax=Aphanomyces astaci TaxID=112090 RepID=A0A6A4ZBS2_APHAT|nr:hypothetical protein AaE_013144 [Aphanomyces astaci]
MAALYIGCMLVWRATDAHDTPDDAEVNVASDTLHPQDTENVYDLVQTVRTPGSPHVVRAVRRLGDLSVFKRFQTQIGDFGGIQALIDLLPIDCRNMDSDSKDLTVAILVALNNLSVHGTNHSIMHAAHVEFLVAEVYEQPSLDLSVRLPCLRLLCNLAMWAESSQTLLALPVIHTLAADLLTSSSADWSDKILQLFVNLTDPVNNSVTGIRGIDPACRGGEHRGRDHQLLRSRG